MQNIPFQENKALYIVGIIGLILAMVLIAFSLYLLPHLLFGWVYDVPGWVIIWRENLVRTYDIGDQFASFVIFLIFFIPGLLAFYVAYVASNRLDNDIYIRNRNEAKQIILKRDISSTTNILLKIIIIVILVIIAAELFEWFLYIEPAIGQEL